jgi:hypothetical protein
LTGGKAYAATRADITRIANDEVGYQADGNQCQKYGTMCADWCAMFVMWVWKAAGVSPRPEGSAYYVATSIGSWGVANNLFKRGNPQPGDLAVYGEPGSGTGGHVSVVYSVDSSTSITTIDGNYSNRVAKRTINPATATAGSRNVRISGYVTPPNVSDVVSGKANHRVRSAGGSWSAFGDLGAHTATAVADAAEPSGKVHALVITGGQIHHRVRGTDGSWTGWAHVGNPGTATAVTAATDNGGNLQVAAVINGQVEHRIRKADTSGWTSWGGVGASGGTFTAVAGAIDNVAKEFHLTAVFNGQIHHRVRKTDGNWTAWAHAGNPGSAISLGATIDHQQGLHLIAAY